MPPVNPYDPNDPRSPRRNRWVRLRLSRWQDWLNLIAGIWIFISAWVFSATQVNYAGSGYTGGADSGSAWITGVIVFLAAAWALSAPLSLWTEWVNMAAGAWLFISPWVLGFAYHNAGASWNDWIVGAIVFFLALSAWWSARHVLSAGTYNRHGWWWPRRHRDPLMP